MQKYVFVWEDSPGGIEAGAIPLVKVADGFATKTGGGFDFSANFKAWLEKYPNAGAWIYLYNEDTVKEITEVVTANVPSKAIIVLDIEVTVQPNVIAPLVAALKEEGHSVWLSTFGLVGQAQTRSIPFSGMGFDVISPQVYYPYQADGIAQWEAQNAGKVIPTYSPGDYPGLMIPDDIDYALWRYPAYGASGETVTPVPTTPSAPSSPVNKENEMQFPPTIAEGAGSKGRNQTVANAQSLLDAHGEHLNIDGVFGPATKSATVNFQTQEKLAADGIIGPLTWTKLILA